MDRREQSRLGKAISDESALSHESVWERSPCCLSKNTMRKKNRKRTQLNTTPVGQHWRKCRQARRNQTLRLVQLTAAMHKIVRFAKANPYGMAIMVLQVIMCVINLRHDHSSASVVLRELGDLGIDCLEVLKDARSKQNDA